MFHAAYIRRNFYSKRLGMSPRRKTVRLVVDFFPDERYNLLLSTFLNYRNVWLDKETGEITICLTKPDIVTLSKKLPRLFRDLDNLNTELLFLREKERLNKNRDIKEY